MMIFILESQEIRFLSISNRIHESDEYRLFNYRDHRNRIKNIDMISLNNLFFEKYYFYSNRRIYS